MAGKTSGNAEQEAVESLPSNTGQVAQPATADAMIAAANPAEAEVPTMKELEGVRYIGFADIKSFSAEDLRSVGVEPKDEDDLVWFADNGKFIKADRINAATRDWLATQSDFQVV